MFISFFNVWYVTTNIENYIIINILLEILLIVRNMLIININLNGKMAKETN